MTNAPDFNTIASDVLARAALVHRFDPLAMMPEAIDPSVEAKALAIVARYASEVDWVDRKKPEQHLTLWRLNPAARRSVLTRLVTEGKLQETLKRSSPLRDDVFAGYLQAALTGKLKPESVAADDRDSAAVAADFAAEALGKDALAGMARQAAASLRTLLSRQTEQRRSTAALPGRLIGRSAEQAILTAFVASGAVPESDRLPVPQRPMIQVRPYLLTGSPGAGKSALVADLVRGFRGYPIDEQRTYNLSDPVGTLISAASAAKATASAVMSAAVGLFQSREAPAEQPVVLLDFDRPSIALGGEFEWTADTSRQLGYGRPELAAKLSEMRARARQDQAKFDPSGKSATAAFTATSDMKTGLARELSAAGFAGRILVVVLDTFEEVVVRSPVATDEQIPASLLGRVLMWADSLATLKSGDAPAFSTVRVIASGREKPDLDPERLGAWFAAHRVIGDLDPDSAVEFLRQRDSKRRFSARLARAAVDKLGGHPLTLILLEAYARDLPAGEIERTINDGNIGRIMGSEHAIRTLYSRFLQRFHHDLEPNDNVTAEMVMAVAHPGLVLREITPDILREVICPACGLGAISADVADALFNRLRTQVWLVDKVEGKNAIRHKSNVRRLMLPMMTGDPDIVSPSSELHAKALQVHHLAAEWYDKLSATDHNARVEALYHRAFLPDEFRKSIAALPEGEAAQLQRRVAESAGDDLNAMPIATRAPLRFFSVGAGRMTADEIQALAPELKRQAEVELLELNRRRGVGNPQVSDVVATPEAEVAASSGAPATAAPVEQEAEKAALNEGSDAPSAGTLEPGRLFDLVADRELHARIGYAFTSGDFDAAANAGWQAIADLSAFPDLTERFRFSEDPTTHWFWQSALAALAQGRRQPPLVELEQYIRRFADSVNSRADISAAGLIFAAATTIALGDRPSPATIEATDKLAQIVARTHRITTTSDLRLLAIHMLWWNSSSPAPELEIQIPFNQIQIFSPALLTAFPNFRLSLDAARKFVDRASGGRISAKEAEAFATSTEYSCILTNEYLDSNWPVGRLVTGVTPELYDSAVRALIDSDNLSYGSVDRAISQAVGRAPFWPYDLMPGEISSRDRDMRAGFLARVVMHADRCGLLVSLFEDAVKANASRHVHRLALLIRRYDEVRGLGYDRSAATA